MEILSFNDSNSTAKVLQQEFSSLMLTSNVQNRTRLNLFTICMIVIMIIIIDRVVRIAKAQKRN